MTIKPLFHAWMSDIVWTAQNFQKNNYHEKEGRINTGYFSGWDIMLVQQVFTLFVYFINIGFVRIIANDTAG